MGSDEWVVFLYHAVGSNRKPVVSHEYTEVRKPRKRITSAPVAPGLLIFISCLTIKPFMNLLGFV